MKKLIVINSLVFICLYLILEIISGSSIYKQKLDCHYLHCNRTYVYENIFTNNEKIIYKRDKYGFKGSNNNLSKIDLLTVGGSTTDQKFINLGDTWPKLVEKKFKEIGKNINVVNAGLGGQSTVGHIWNFKNWFSKLKIFKTDYIIFFIGINDNDQKTYMNISKYDHGKIKTKNILDKLIVLLKENNGITYKFVKFFYKKHFLKNKQIFSYEEKNKDDYQKIEKMLSLTKVHEVNLYNNLQELAKLSSKINAIPIFITQKSLRGNIINSTVVSMNNVDYHHSEIEIAKLIISFCKENNIFCIDLHSKIKFEYDDFYDLVHTTKKGTKKIAELIFFEMNNHNPNLFE